MKELTYEDWQKNPAPRMMWVWNDDVKNKEKIKVAYVLNNDCTYRVLSIVDEDSAYETFKHCAEIEKSKTRRMTYKELSRWLRKNSTREYKYITGSYIYASFDYREKNQNVEVHESMRIRENDGEWKEPLIEVEL